MREVKTAGATAVKAAGNLLKNANLSADAIKAGKNQLKLQVLSEAEHGTSLAESIATQGLYTGAVKSPAEVAKDIDQLSNSDISQALSNAAKNKISMGAAGNLTLVPYVDEL